MAPVSDSDFPSWSNSTSIPVQPPPPGVIPNFAHAVSHDRIIIATSTIVITLSTIFVCLRLYTRIRITRVFGADDVLLLFGYSAAVANSALVLAQLKYGLGRHAWDISLATAFPYSFLFTWVQAKVYIVSLTFTKLALLYLYPRISPDKKFQVIVWILIAFVIVWGFACFVWSIFWCSPPEAYWRLDLALEGHCTKNLSFMAVSGSLNVITDVILVLVPIHMVRNSMMDLRKKVYVAIVLSTGSLVSVISLIRMIVSIHLLSTLNDISWRVPLLLDWSSAEVHMAVVCACLPTLLPFFREHFSHMSWFSGSNRSRQCQNTSGHLANASIGGGKLSGFGTGAGGHVKRGSVAGTSEESILVETPENELRSLALIHRI